MQKSRLTVYYDGAFWVGVYERISDGRLEACKILFGAEPKDYEVYSFLLENWGRLRFGPSVEAHEREDGKMSPKRMQRNVKKQLEAHGTGTKSQQALQLEREEHNTLRKERSRRLKEEEKQRQFEQKQEKRKERHRGR